MFLGKYDPLKHEMVGILAPDGSCNPALRPSLDDTQIRQMYRHMTKLSPYSVRDVLAPMRRWKARKPAWWPVWQPCNVRIG
jgi:hypothetical protein